MTRHQDSENRFCHWLNQGYVPTANLDGRSQWGPVRNLRRLPVRPIPAAPHDTESLIELERLYKIVATRAFYNPPKLNDYSYYVTLIPGPVVDWFSRHALSEIHEQVALYAALLIVFDWRCNRRAVFRDTCRVYHEAINRNLEDIRLAYPKLRFSGEVKDAEDDAVFEVVYAAEVPCSDEPNQRWPCRIRTNSPDDSYCTAHEELCRQVRWERVVTRRWWHRDAANASYDDETEEAAQDQDLLAKMAPKLPPWHAPRLHTISLDDVKLVQPDPTPTPPSYWDLYSTLSMPWQRPDEHTGVDDFGVVGYGLFDRDEEYIDTTLAGDDSNYPKDDNLDRAESCPDAFEYLLHARHAKNAWATHQ
jgi:hypothetical protein